MCIVCLLAGAACIEEEEKNKNRLAGWIEMLTFIKSLQVQEAQLPNAVPGHKGVKKIYKGSFDF